jgi:aconitase B
MGETMIEKLMTLLVGILLTLAGWSLSRTFQLSTIQAVHEDKVERLEKHVDKLQLHIENMMDKDKEIMDQHKKLFEALDNNQPTTGYNYN